MKEIIAIIRPNKMTKTSEVLNAIGFPAMTAWRIMGRGKQKAMAGEVSFDIGSELLKHEGGMKYVPKRLLTLLVDDDEVSLIVAVIMRINRSGQVGDGRIFVCPVDEVIRVRTRERGTAAIN